MLRKKSQSTMTSYDSPPTQIYTLSLHDALPISRASISSGASPPPRATAHPPPVAAVWRWTPRKIRRPACSGRPQSRSEEHTSELQSHVNIVCRLLIEKKKEQLGKAAGWELDSVN